jgi:hypothetical protein
MTWIEDLFSLSMKLYPRQFRERFADEMEEVFFSGLSDAKQNGVIAGYLIKELLHLPSNLIGIYMWSLRMDKSKQVAVSSIGNGSGGVDLPGEGWSSSIMAGLPHLLMAIMIVGSEILFKILDGSQQVIGLIFVAGVSILVVGMIVYSLMHGWKIWSATWLVYIFGIAITLVSLLANAIPDTLIKNNNLVYEIQTLVIPLLLAYLLYKIACKDRFWGLLAAIPPATIIWTVFLEFVPSLQKSIAWGWIFLLAFTASVLIVRTKHFTTAMIIALAVSVLGGLPFVYLGVYMGGTLPFSEPGPSLQEVLRQYLPFVVVAMTLVLGPQLALKIRTIGHQYSKQRGKIFYRLALGGILLGLVFSMIQWVSAASSGVDVQASTSRGLWVLSLVLYIVGYGLLLWTVHRNKPPYGDNSDSLELIALFFPLLFVPLMILFLIPVLMGSYADSWWVPAGEIGWVVASILVVRN